MNTMKVKRPWGLHCLLGFPRYNYCGNCGKQLYGYPKFCGNCGTNLDWLKCSNCGVYLGEEDKTHCQQCGHKLLI